VFHGDELYHLARSSAVSDIQDAIDWSGSAWQFVGTVTTEPARWSGQSRFEATQNELEACAFATRLIAVYAFDGEGYVIWRAD
jgi:hypothetical protein